MSPSEKARLYDDIQIHGGLTAWVRLETLRSKHIAELIAAAPETVRPVGPAATERVCAATIPIPRGVVA